MNAQPHKDLRVEVSTGKTVQRGNDKQTRTKTKTEKQEPQEYCDKGTKGNVTKLQQRLYRLGLIYLSVRHR